MFVVLARLLGPEVYGLVGMALIVTTIGTLLVGRAGWIEAVVQRRDLTPVHLDSLFWFLVALGLTSVAIIAIGAPFVAAWFGTPEVARILPWLALTLPLSALGVVPGALLRRELQFRALALRSFAGALVGGIAGVTAAVGGAEAWSLVVQQLSQLFTEAVVVWAAVPWRPRVGFSWRHLAQLGRFTQGVFASKALQICEDLVARTLIARALGAIGVGHYTVARRILLLSEDLLITPLNSVALPVFAKLGLRQGHLHEPLRLGMQVGAVLAFPGYVGLALVIPDLLPLVFGEQWSAAVPAVQLAALLGPALQITRLCETLLLALGHLKTYAGLNAVSTAVLLLLVLVPDRITVETVMAAMVVRTYLTLPLVIALAQWVSGIDVGGSVRSLVPLLWATMLMAGAVLVVQWMTGSQLGPVERLTLSILAGIGVYSLVVLVLARPLIDHALQHILPGRAHDGALLRREKNSTRKSGE